MGSNAAGGMDVLFVANFVCCQVDVSETSRFLIHWSPTGCFVSLCYLETSKNEVFMACIGLLHQINNVM